jgi:hypothetical protein
MGMHGLANKLVMDLRHSRTRRDIGSAQPLVRCIESRLVLTATWPGADGADGWRTPAPRDAEGTGGWVGRGASPGTPAAGGLCPAITGAHRRASTKDLPAGSGEELDASLTAEKPATCEDDETVQSGGLGEGDEDNLGGEDDLGGEGE